ncbi:DNA repair protein RecN [Rhodothermus profundi]|uniref:DNA repair protein RecN n=1 Tax=Rhodothermus profundi TaxID=633813 RepID=A0A1M6XBK2_9BACT|nr:DNA repair protein RecN [Rhodothermus profundi]SHL03334.1 DNA replication and repair protein RecN [Rhodothermus profundi]
MLRTLYIRDYALIEELEVEFGSGLNILTGETGAGKSILIGALKMILGERADSEMIRSGARKAIIEGIFDEADTPAIRALLEANAIDPLPQLIVRREILPGQSRAFINDTPATVQLLREVAAHLIDLHGQHEHQSLLRTETHLELLDNFGSLGGLRDTYRRHYEEVARLMREREALMARRRELQEEKERYAFEIEEIDRVNPQEGEEEALEAELRILEHAEQLYEATARLYELLYESENAVHDQLVLARNELQDLVRIDPSFDEALQEIRSAQISVAEIAKFLQDYNARIEFNPERLEEIRARLVELELLKRKYGGTLEAVLAHRAEIGRRYELAVDFEGALERLDRQLTQAMQALSAAAQRLSAKRREVAERIEQAIVNELAVLGMPDSRFEVRFTRRPDPDGWIVMPVPGRAPERYAAFSTGMDQVEFFITTNPGEPLRPLARVASGGEVSRIMLALKTILAKSDRLPILVFDEIDTGISGAVAHRVGERLHDLANYHQIIAITHLPQIAAFGDVHFLVEKVVEEGRAKTRIRRLSDEERAQQVAALMSGAEVTEAALESARELIRQVAAREKAPEA